MDGKCSVNHPLEKHDEKMQWRDHAQEMEGTRFVSKDAGMAH